jgi:hypothetical protein
MAISHLTFPASWTATARKRRLLFLALAAPGFGCVFATPLHQNLLVLSLGAVGFLAAVAFRIRTEPRFSGSATPMVRRLHSPGDLEHPHAD